jgi:hypothetical protein
MRDGQPKVHLPTVPPSEAFDPAAERAKSDTASLNRARWFSFTALVAPAANQSAQRSAALVIQKISREK